MRFLALCSSLGCATEPLPTRSQEMAKWMVAEKERNAKLITATGFDMKTID